jgi:hypothetical protein
MRVTIEASIAQACNFEAAHYLLFIYVLINFALRYLSYIASNIGQDVKYEMKKLEIKLSLSNLPSVHMACEYRNKYLQFDASSGIS